MAATGKDMPTAAGTNSYTSALIKSLRLLRERPQPFTTSDLNQMIMKQRHWNTASQLYNRRQNMRARHICLAPPAKPSSALIRYPVRRAAYLDLRIAFAEKSALTLEEVEKLASELSKLSKSTGLNICDLEWIGFTPHKDSPQFKQLVRIAQTTNVCLGAMERYKMKKRRRLLEQLHHPSSPKRRRTEPEPPKSPVFQCRKSLTDQSPLTPPSASSRSATPIS